MKNQMKINSFGFMPATYEYSTDKHLLNYYGENYTVCFLTAIDGEGYRRYVKDEIISKLKPHEQYLFSFNIEAKSHRVFIVDFYEKDSIVSIERRIK